MKDLVKTKENKLNKDDVKLNIPQNYGKAFKLDIFIVSIVVIVFGALFVTFPQDSLDILCRTFGVAMCVWGVVSLIMYFVSEKYVLFDSYGLVRGIALLALGIVVLANPDEVADLFVSIFGALIIVDGALKLQYSVDLMRVKDKGWRWLMPAAFVIIILGGIVIANLFDNIDSQMFFTGIAMIIDGVLDAVMVIYIYTVINRLKKGESK